MAHAIAIAVGQRAAEPVEKSQSTPMRYIGNSNRIEFEEVSPA